MSSVSTSTLIKRILANAEAFGVNKQSGEGVKKEEQEAKEEEEEHVESEESSSSSNSSDEKVETTKRTSNGSSKKKASPASSNAKKESAPVHHSLADPTRSFSQTRNNLLEEAVDYQRNNKRLPVFSTTCISLQCTFALWGRYR